MSVQSRLARGGLSLTLALGILLSALSVSVPQALTADISKDCNRTSVGFRPVIDMGATEYYPSASHPDKVNGGLYGNGLNSAPAGHMLQAQSASALIVPRDANGNPSASGKIGFISLGMSNTSSEFDTFSRSMSGSPLKSPYVVTINGAQPGMTAFWWAHPSSSRDPWINFNQRIQDAGLTNRQVQVVWMKLTDINPQPGPDDFPVFARRLRDEMAIITKRLKQDYTNIRLVYLSSRIYAGYSLSPQSPEPFAYEGAFSDRWLIQDQIDGGTITGVTYGNAPVLLWGPYLWADGLNPNGQGLLWECSDFTDDGVHPSATSGNSKVSQKLVDFLTTDPLARQWFSPPGSPTPTPRQTPTPRLSPTPTRAGQPTPTATRTPSPTATPPAGALFSDSFDRADSSSVGNAWTEAETTGANAGIQAGRLCFLDTSDVANRPMVWHAFPQAAAGRLTWEFDFDWTRTGDESTYSLFMQLGQGSLMNNASQDVGVGVSLVWVGQGAAQQTLGYRRDGVTSSLRSVSGAAHLAIVADLDAHTYSLSVNGVQAATGIPFEDAVNLDRVRLFTSGLNEVNFSGRCFDRLSIGAGG